MALILTAMVFIITVILVVAIGSLMAARRTKVESRLSGIRKMTVDSAPEEILHLPFMQRVVAPAFSSIGHFFGRLAPQEIRTRIDKKIIYAGRPWNLNFYSFLAVQVLMAAALFFVFLFLFRVSQVEVGRAVFVLLIMIMLGFYIPYFIISSKADARQFQIRRALPDMLDMLLVSVEAGLGFDMAMKKVTQQLKGPLSEEVKKALDEIRMGGDRETAFRSIARRCGVSELSNFISSIIQSEQLGSNIAGTLRVQSDYMRQRRRQAAQEMAQKAPVKLVFPLILFIFPALFVVIIGPAVIRIFEMFGLMF